MFIFTNNTTEQPGDIILTVCVIWSGGLHLLFVTNRFFIYYFFNTTDTPAFFKWYYNTL